MDWLPRRPASIALHAVVIGAISGLAMAIIGGHGFLGGAIVFVSIAVVDVAVSIVVGKLM
jgi:hypothetical protein